MARAFEVVDHSNLFTEYEDESDCVALLRMLAREIAYVDSLCIAFDTGLRVERRDQCETRQPN